MEGVDVLHIAANMADTVEAKEVADLAIQSNRAGWHAAVASAKGPLVLDIERAAVRHFPAVLNHSGAMTRMMAMSQVGRIIRRVRPAILHVHGLANLALGMRLAVTNNIPVLMDVREPEAITPGILRRVKKSMALGMHFRVPSMFMARHMIGDMGVDERLVHHIPPGVDMVAFDPARMTTERLHRLVGLWRLPEHGPVIVTAMPLAPGCGQMHLLESMEKLKAPEAFLVMVGDDSHARGTREIIEKKIALCGLEGRVVMPEKCPDWPAAFWLASMVVAANGVPRGQAPELLAAQAMGRPVVATACGANSEVISNGETGLVVPPEDCGELAGAIAEALRLNAAQRTEMAVLARDFVMRNFPQQSHMAAMAGLYDLMLGRRGGLEAGGAGDMIKAV